MSASYIQVDTNFPNHRKSLRLARLLGPAAVGHVVILWCWAAQNRQDGDLSGMEKADIEAAAKWGGGGGKLALMLREVGFLDGDDMNYKIHGWKQWQKYFAQLRKNQQNAARQKSHRERYSVTHRNAEVTPRLEEIRREEIRSEEPKIKTPRAKPALDVHPDFVAFWKAYPRKVGKGAAMKAWLTHRPPPDAVLAALQWQAASEQWTKQRGAFIPHPATYLNQRRWEDEPLRLVRPPDREMKFDANGDFAGYDEIGA